jgi:hypothetical protein
VTDHKGLRPVSDGLDGILQRLGLPADLDMSSIVQDWPEVSGEPFSRLSRPSGLRAGELVLEVDDGAAATLIKYRISELLERLDERYGRGRVTSVRITVARSKNRP